MSDQTPGKQQQNEWYIAYNELIGLHSWDILGYSSEYRPILTTSIGTGKRSICIWAGMHGNETTGVFIILDLIRKLQKKQPGFLRDFQLNIVPVANPDAYVRYTRRNGLGIDLNRDFASFQTLESAKLVGWIRSKEPELCINLHDQRSIFHLSGIPAYTSLLVPSADHERTLTPLRTATMARVGAALANLNYALEGIGRFTDEFYPTAVGDYLMSKGIANVLVESGVALNDWSRSRARAFGVAFIESLIVSNENRIDVYENLPLNQQGMLEWVFTGVRYASMRVDVAVKRVQMVIGHERLVQYQVDDIGDLQFRPRHLSIDCSLISLDQPLAVGAPISADFGSYLFEDGALINAPEA